ncbi:MAG: anti-sigma factor antagonist [Clostridiales bacterium]|jgi:anti-sigma B factor antagonist|nr:anti-sigma factor antagonist [Clostridiales bacterium]
MASNLSVIEKKSNEVVVVELNGEIDISTVTELKDKLYAIIEKNNKDVRLDCENLTYIDSTGLGVLVGALKKVKNNNKDIYIVNLRSNIKKLFLITGLDNVFKIEE